MSSPAGVPMGFGGWMKGVERFSAEAGSVSTFRSVGESG
jgi:hypothetical protein